MKLSRVFLVSAFNLTSQDGNNAATKPFSYKMWRRKSCFHCGCDSSLTSAVSLSAAKYSPPMDAAVGNRNRRLETSLIEASFLAFFCGAIRWEERYRQECFYQGNPPLKALKNVMAAGVGERRKRTCHHMRLGKDKKKITAVPSNGGFLSNRTAVLLFFSFL